MVQLFNGLWLPDREEYLKPEIANSPMFYGRGTIQFKKFAAAFPHIKNWRHAVDVGANLGIWTRVMARCFSKVTCFEPNPECYEAFFLNQDGDFGCKVELHKVALGEERRTVKINTKLRSTGFVRIDNFGDLSVEQYSLDSFELDEVDFIKIDVEGWEHNVIKGARETIKRCRPTIILEQKPENAERHGLKQYGAKNLLIKMGMREIREISGDFIMVW